MCISILHAYILTFSVLEWLRLHNHSGFSHTLLTASPGREWMLSSSSLEGGEMEPRAAVEGLDKLWRCEQSTVAGLSDQSLPPRWQWGACNISSRCASFPPLPLRHHSFGRDYSSEWKFSMRGLHSKGEGRWNSEKKSFPALQLDGKMVVCVFNIQKRNKKNFSASQITEEHLAFTKWNLPYVKLSMKKNVPVKFEKREDWHYSNFSGQLPPWLHECDELCCATYFDAMVMGFTKTPSRIGKRSSPFLVLLAPLKWS